MRILKKFNFRNKRHLFAKSRYDGWLDGKIRRVDVSKDTGLSSATVFMTCLRASAATSGKMVQTSLSKCGRFVTFQAYSQGDVE